MNYKRYDVKAIYGPTNRKRSRIIELREEEDIKKHLKNQEYIEPFEITEIPFNGPTEKQINFATELGINLPNDATTEDVSALISREVDDDIDPNPEFYKFADDRGFLFSKYIGQKRLYAFVFSQMDVKDKIAFFAFCVYRYFSEERSENLDKCLYKEVFYLFADKKLSNQGFINSLEANFSGSDLLSFSTAGLKNTKAFRETVSCLKENSLIQKQDKNNKELSKAESIVANATVKSNKNIHDIIPSPEKNKKEAAAARNKNNGCASVIVLGIIVPIIINILI